jgi:hypothetical protein
VRATVRTVAAIVGGYRHRQPKSLTVIVARALLRRAVQGRRVAPQDLRDWSWELTVPVALLAIAGWRRRWVTEDAFINFRIVAVTRHGRQPFAFNSGERVEAGTSPLWLATLVALDAALGRFVPLERLAAGGWRPAPGLACPCSVWPRPPQPRHGWSAATGPVGRGPRGRWCCRSCRPSGTSRRRGWRPG